MRAFVKHFPILRPLQTLVYDSVLNTRVKIVPFRKSRLSLWLKKSKQVSVSECPVICKSDQSLDQNPPSSLVSFMIWGHGDIVFLSQEAGSIPQPYFWSLYVKASCKNIVGDLMWKHLAKHLTIHRTPSGSVILSASSLGSASLYPRDLDPGKGGLPQPS